MSGLFGFSIYFLWVFLGFFFSLILGARRVGLKEGFRMVGGTNHHFLEKILFSFLAMAYMAQ